MDDLLSETMKLEQAVGVLNTHRVWAVIGVSREPEKYGHEVFDALRSGGFAVYPINAKYTEIDGSRCYPSLGALPERPEVVVIALSPPATERVVLEAIASDPKVIWLPPGCYTPAAVEACEGVGMREVHGICPVFALSSRRMRGSAEE